MVRELMTPSFCTENAYCDIGANGHQSSLPTQVPRQTVVTTAAVTASRHSTAYGPSERAGPLMLPSRGHAPTRVTD